MYDFLIKKGFVVDGTGGPWYRADVAISGSKIVDMNSRLPKSKADTVIDAKGLVISPGFIDMHSHSELNYLVYPKAESKVMQGVTTEFNCQCGTSGSGPLKGVALESVKRSMEQMLPGFKVDWTTLAEYIDRLNRQGFSLNGCFQAGHGTVRQCVIGWENRAPTNDEMDEMKALVAQTMEEGAFGLSTGTMFPPGNFAETEEIIELCKVVRKYGGIHTSHIRRLGFENEPRGGRDFIVRVVDSQYWAIMECIRIGEEAGIPTTWSHARAIGETNRDGPLKDWLKDVEFARRTGIDVGIDAYPWLYRGALVRGIPTWANEGGPDKLMERLKDPQTGRKIREILNRNMSSITAEHTWDRALITSASLEDEDLIGKTIAEAAEIRGIEAVDLYLDRLIKGKPFRGHARAFSEDDVRTLLKHPLTMVGTDGNAMPADPTKKTHPRSFGTYPKILRKYVMEERLIPMEEAIRKMTSAPANRLGLMDRGLLRPGFWADVVVFDPLNIRETTTYADPMNYPQGIEYVFVNGVKTVEKGKHTGALAGKPLKHRSAED